MNEETHFVTYTHIHAAPTAWDLLSLDLLIPATMPHKALMNLVSLDLISGWTINLLKGVKKEFFKDQFKL